MQATNRIKDDASVASRYLAGQLSAAEQEAYEQHFIENPDVVQELEATARMKVGLANLRDTGQIESVLRDAPRQVRRNSLLALAASVAIAALGIVLWRGTAQVGEAILFTSSSRLTDRAGQPLALGGQYALLRTRASDHDAVVQLPSEPSAIELRVRPESQASEFRATLAAIRADGSVTQVAAVDGLRAETDRFVRLYVDSSQLSPGPYLLVLSATKHEPGDVATSSFRIKVVGTNEAN